MSKFFKIVTIAATLSALSSQAFAKDAAANVSFSYDKTAPIEVTYEKFETTAEKACRLEARRAGYRAAETSTWERRKCAKDLVTKAVKATKNQRLIALNTFANDPRTQVIKLASK